MAVVRLGRRGGGERLLQRASFHGAGRVVDRDGRWWAAALLLLLGVAGSALLTLVQRYASSPTFLTKTEKFRNNTVFPAVLICPEAIFPPHKIDRFIEQLTLPRGVTPEWLRQTLPMLAAYMTPQMPYSISELQRIEQLLDKHDVSIGEAIKQLSLDCDDMLLRCRFDGVWQFCKNIFNFYVTGNGMCCVFHGRSIREEIQNFGLKRVNTLHKYFSNSLGPTSGLMVVINQTVRYKDMKFGFKWMATDVGQTFVDQRFTRLHLEPGREHWASFSNRLYTVGDDVSLLPDDFRRCRLQTYPLEYFPFYERSLCLLECEMKLTLKACGCLKPLQPRLLVQRYCGAAELACSRNITMDSRSIQNCGCPKVCDHAIANVQDSSQLLGELACNDPMYHGLQPARVSVVRVFMRRRLRRLYTHVALMTYLDLFAACGGVINVYFGCSILTILELVMILIRTLRSCRTCPRLQRKQVKPAVTVDRRP